jgi:hypothetical protein
VSRDTLERLIRAGRLKRCRRFGDRKTYVDMAEAKQVLDGGRSRYQCRAVEASATQPIEFGRPRGQAGGWRRGYDEVSARWSTTGAAFPGTGRVRSGPRRSSAVASRAFVKGANGELETLKLDIAPHSRSEDGGFQPTLPMQCVFEGVSGEEASPELSAGCVGALAILIEV